MFNNRFHFYWSILRFPVWICDYGTHRALPSISYYYHRKTSPSSSFFHNTSTYLRGKRHYATSRKTSALWGAGAALTCPWPQSLYESKAAEPPDDSCCIDLARSLKNTLPFLAFEISLHFLTVIQEEHPGEDLLARPLHVLSRQQRTHI